MTLVFLILYFPIYSCCVLCIYVVSSVYKIDGINRRDSFVSDLVKRKHLHLSKEVRKIVFQSKSKEIL